MKKLRGLFRVVFGRTAFVILFLLIQVGILFGVIRWLGDYLIYAYGLALIITSFAVIYILNARENASFKMAWIIPVLVFPVFGVLFFLFALAILYVLPQQVAISEKDTVNGRAFPTLLMVVMMICCAMLVAKEIYKLITKQPLNWKVINLQTELKALVILAILVVTYLLCRYTDLFVVGAIFCCLGFLVYFRCKKPSYYVITLTLAVAIWAAFRFVLHVDF